MRRTLEVIASTSRLEPYVKIIAASPVRRMRATGSWRKSVWSHTPERTRGPANSNRTAGAPHGGRRVRAKVCVVPHSGAHARLSQLEQNGGDAADEYGHRIAEHTPTHGIGTEDAGIAGRLEIINGLSAPCRIGQAQDHSLQPYPRRTQERHPVEARNRGCGRVLDSGHHGSPHYTDSATKGFYRIYQTSCEFHLLPPATSLTLGGRRTSTPSRQLQSAR